MNSDPSTAAKSLSDESPSSGLIVAVGSTAFDSLVEDDAHALLPLADRSIIETQMVRLIEAGVDCVHVVVFESPAAIRTLLGEGPRWGVPVRYHLVRQRNQPLRVLDRLPDLAEWIVVDCRCLATIPDRPGIVADADSRFTGTARGTAAELCDLQVGRLCDGRREDVGWLNSPAAMLETTGQLLAGPRFGVDVFADQPEAVAIGRNVRLHPQAVIHPPVVIAADCDVGRGVVLGPSVVLGAGCVLDDNAELRDAIVGTRTYVGTGLDVERSIVSGDRLAHARLGTTLSIQDRSLIDTITPASKRQLARQSVLYLLGLLLWLLTRPLAVAAQLLRLGPLRSNIRNHFIHQFLPGLWDVACGRRRLVGTSGSVNTLWTAPTSPKGLVSESVVHAKSGPGTLETVVADSHYAATSSFRGDLKLLGLYLRDVASGGTEIAGVSPRPAS